PRRDRGEPDGIARRPDSVVVPKVIAMHGGWLPRLFGFLGAGYLAVFASILAAPTAFAAPALLVAFGFLVIASVVTSRLVGHSMRIGLFDLEIRGRRVSAGDIVDCRLERSLGLLWMVRLETRDRVWHLLIGGKRAELQWLVRQVRELMARFEQREGEIPDDITRLAGQVARQAASRVEQR
ncbi:MAG: hypothetical protein AAF602_28370, partial [Myxococcota bacterium]